MCPPPPQLPPNHRPEAAGRPWFFDPAVRPGVVPLSPAESRHALGSLRLSAGDAIALFDGAGRVGVGRLLGADAAGGGRKARRAALVEVESVVELPPPSRPLTLVAAAAKGDRLEWLVEKSTELGVARIVISGFERSVVHVGASHAAKLTATAMAACKQCRRGWLPEIMCGVSLTAALAELIRASETGAPPPPAAQARSDLLSPPPALLVGDPDAGAAPLGAWLAAHQPRSAALVVGPEGGLTPAERSLLDERGAVRVRIGQYVLRIETAAVAGAAAWAAAGV